MSEEIKTRYPRAAALGVAREICAALKPVTTRLIVAGSLRRRKELVGDVEILYVPKAESVKVDLFGERDVDLAEMALSQLMDDGIIHMRMGKNGQRIWGNQNKLAVHTRTGIPIDFFRASDANWFNLLVCRTGSALTNTRIATLALAKGLKWNPYSVGFSDATDAFTPVNSEEDVFRIVGLRYLEPWER